MAIYVGPDSYTLEFGGVNPRTGLVGPGFTSAMSDQSDSTYLVLGSDSDPTQGGGVPQNGDTADVVWTTPFGTGVGDESTVTYAIRLKVDPDQTTINESRVQLNIYNNRFDTGDAFGTWIVSLPNPAKWYDLDLTRGPTLHPTLGSIVYYADDNGHLDGDSASDCWVTFQNRTSTDWDTDGTDNDDPWPGLMLAASLGTLEVDINRTGGASTPEDYPGNVDLWISELSFASPAAALTAAPKATRRRFVRHP